MKIGILGGGQLGRMMILAGYPLGLDFRVFEPTTGSPTTSLAPTTHAPFDDEAALDRFTTEVDVVTYELEHLPLQAVRFVAERKPVFPPPRALEIGQDRLLEKGLFRSLGIPTPRCAPIVAPDDVAQALEVTGLPAVLKTTQLGYDGKGQRIAHSHEEGRSAFAALGARALIAEELIRFDREVSVIGVRSRTGEERFYPLAQNRHERGILIRSDAPAPDLTPALQQEAEEYCRRVMREVDYVGVLTIEFFVRDGHLVANEMAPRVHNSGHWTIEGATCSQFENHLRAVIGLPLGSTGVGDEWTMFNLVGGEPSVNALCSLLGAHLHLYGKSSKPGRKIGHVTVRRRDATSVERHVKNVLS